MKKKMMLILSVIAVMFLIFSCSEDSTAPTDNEDPTVVVTYPANNSEFPIGTEITIIADATDNEEIKEVKFYIDGEFASLDESEPYEYDWIVGDRRDENCTIYAEAFDTSDNTGISDVINVTITNIIGNAPNPPSNPDPSHNAVYVSLDTHLSWNCTDPDGDPLTYDVYFGTASNPPLINSGQSETNYVPGTLSEETTYYWKIKARDDQYNSTSGDIWQFTSVSSGDFEWCDIPAGDYTWGMSDEIQNIDYDYQIMKNKVTNIEYKQFLDEAYNMGSVWLAGDYVEGYYPGDENIGAGNQILYTLGTPINFNYAQISFHEDEFLINVPDAYNDGDFDNHPVIYATWFGAWAFAQHYELRLPTEQEWEKAARGMTGYEYPWGNNISGDRANFFSSGDPWDNGTTPVGYYNGENNTTDSPSPYGVYDMCGNVFDWTNSWFCDTIHERVLRGGYWVSASTDIYLHSCRRHSCEPTHNSNINGFRCAKTP